MFDYIHTYLNSLASPETRDVVAVTDVVVGVSMSTIT